MVVRNRAFPRGAVALALTALAVSCAGRSVSESDGSGGTGGDAGNGGTAASSGGTGGVGGSVPGSGGTGGAPGSGGAVAQGGGTTTGGSGGTSGVGGSLGKGATGGTGLGGKGGTAQGGSGPIAGTDFGGTAGSVAIGGSGGTPPADVCLEPIVIGSCSAYFLRWGFNTATGQCEQFVYGGCGGNANNFETEAECVARCEPMTEATACMSPGDCALVDPVCCRCDAALSDLLAVNYVYVNDILAPCALVDCEGCPGPTFSPWFTSLCEAGQCVAVDARKHELTRCSVDTDCRLRMGLGCCDCGSAPVAVNVNVSVESLVCPESGCMADCAPQYPSTAFPRCMEDGHCGVVHLLPLN